MRLVLFKKPSIEQTNKQPSNIKQANILVLTDGGLRDDDCAAACWIIGLWDSENHKYEPYQAGGSHLESSSTVLLAEAIAIDEDQPRCSTLT